MLLHRALLLKSDDRDVGSAKLAGVLGVGFRLKGDLLAFFQLFKAIALDGGEVNEDIAASIVIGDEAVALFGIEPFNSTIQHSENLPHFKLPREMERSHE